MANTIVDKLAQTQKQNPNGTATVPPVKPVKYSQGGSTGVNAVNSLKSK